MSLSLNETDRVPLQLSLPWMRMVVSCTDGAVCVFHSTLSLSFSLFFLSFLCLSLSSAHSPPLFLSLHFSVVISLSLICIVSMYLTWHLIANFVLLSGNPFQHWHVYYIDKSMHKYVHSEIGSSVLDSRGILNGALGVQHQDQNSLISIQFSNPVDV